MEIKHLFFSYGKNIVIKDLSLKIEKNKITTFLGANGCGKSTLFKLITRVEKPKMGMISLDGKNIKDFDRKDFAKKVAIVRQKNQIAGDIKVEELVSYGRNPYIGFMKKPNKGDREKIEELERVFATADLVKFAKYSTQDNEKDYYLGNVVEFIEETKAGYQPPKEIKETKAEQEDKRNQRMRLILRWCKYLALVAAIALGIIAAMGIWELMN